MPFLQLTFAIGAADPAPFEEALLASGAVSITLEDAADNPVLEPAPGTTPLWPSVRIKALFTAEADPHVVTLLLEQQLSAPLPPLDFAPLADRIWEREWLKDFRPMRFGRRLWICPGGQRPGAAEVAKASTLISSGKPADDLPSPLTLSRNTGERELAETVLIELDPGLAFGTGTHPTTALCLEWLDGADARNKTIIDYGCGSGVLAIASLKLGASSAVAVDIDPQAITATIDNARRNQVADCIRVSTVDALATAPGGVMTAAPADILLANILAEPLEALAGSLAALVVPGGQLVLSGLLAEQAQRVAVCYEPWFDMSPPTISDGWARLHGVRRAADRR
jgi:ribosomal protein L11 methyltransferase